MDLDQNSGQNVRRSRRLITPRPNQGNRPGAQQACPLVREIQRQAPHPRRDQPALDLWSQTFVQIIVLRLHESGFGFLVEGT